MSTGDATPSELAGYRLQRELGRGGIGVVYLAVDRFGHRVALKVLAPYLAQDEGYRQRFLRGGRWEAALDHPSIAAVYDAGEDQGLLYLVSRYVEGESLKTLIERVGPLPLARTLLILDQVAAALDTAHEHGLVHGHVRPSNIVVASEHDHTFVTDFLLAATPATPESGQAGFMGSPDYPTPEQIEHSGIDERTDLYLLASVFYECLTGVQPYAETGGGIALLHAHLKAPPPLLTAARPDLPFPIDRVLARAMAKPKEARYPSCGEFILAAERACHLPLGG